MKILKYLFVFTMLICIGAIYYFYTHIHSFLFGYIIEGWQEISCALWWICNSLFGLLIITVYEKIKSQKLSYSWRKENDELMSANIIYHAKLDKEYENRMKQYNLCEIEKDRLYKIVNSVCSVVKSDADEKSILNSINRIKAEYDNKIWNIKQEEKKEKDVLVEEKNKLYDETLVLNKEIDEWRKTNIKLSNELETLYKELSDITEKTIRILELEESEKQLLKLKTEREQMYHEQLQINADQDEEIKELKRTCDILKSGAVKYIKPIKSIKSKSKTKKK